MTLSVGLLGPLQVSVDDQPVELPAGRLSTLLAVLAMSARQTVSGERLAAAVWGNDVSVDARANLQTNVRRLRRLLGSTVIVTRAHGYTLDIPPDQVDALRFTRLLDLASAIPDPPTQRSLLVDALHLWRGAPFDGMRSAWLEHTQAPQLQERYLAAVERRVDLDLADASYSHADLVAELSELTAHYPLRESLWVRLIAALQRCGRSAEALEYYERIRVRLAEDLGADPGPELQRMHAELLAGGPPEVPGTPFPATDRIVPRQLPPDTVAFTGRDPALKTLDGLLGDPEEQTPRPVVVAAITGTAGVGKTTLAIHWAHQVADRLPDGNLYINLRGFDPSGSPTQPTEAVRRFLDALQVPPSAIPASPEAQADLYRSVLSGRRMLIVLDNARDADQVATLLPGAPGCFVLVTSRHQLPGLVAAGAHPVGLDLLSHDEAVQLLARRLSHDRVMAEPAPTDEIVARSARLPLALAIVAARAATHPQLPLAGLAAQLREARDGLDSFDGGDLATDARAVFSWSYRSLTAPAARLYRLLGLHPGPDATVNATASLAGQPVAEVGPLLAELSRAHLLVEHIQGRYTSHDLLRAHARELGYTEDTLADRQAATHRMLDHYVHTSHSADLQLFQHNEPIILASPQPGVTVHQVSDQGQAMAWFTAEHPVLLGVVAQAGRDGFPRHTCHQAWTMFVYLHRRGLWHDRAATQQAALDAARELGDARAQARSHRYLGSACADLGHYDDADLHLRRALDVSIEIGDPVEQGWSHYYRDLMYGLYGHDVEALDSAERALHLFRTAGDQVGQAVALTDVGWYRGRLGNHQMALELCTQALTLHQELDNLPYQAHTWSCLSDTYQHLDDLPSAIDCLQHSLDLFRACRDRYGEASALAKLGELHGCVGNADAAREAWLAGQDILDELDAPAAEQVRAQLSRFDQAAAATRLHRPTT